jgi:outer membrane protein assembly factor BamB
MTGRSLFSAFKKTLWMKVAAILSTIAVIAAMVVFLGTSSNDVDTTDATIGLGTSLGTDAPIPGDDGNGGGDDNGGDGNGGGSDGGGDNGGDGNGGGDGGGDNGGDGNGGGDGGGGSGGSGGSGGTSGGGGGSGGSGGGSGGGGGGALPPSGPSLCGPQEFLGGLPEFVAKIGNPNLIPTVINNDPIYNKKWKLFDFITPDLPLPAPIGAPITIIGGFNQAYMPLGDIVKGQCPRITGDPHVYTIDGWRYDFMAVGEYVAMRSDDGTVEVQIRTVPYLLTSNRASGVAGVALTVDGRTLVVDNMADELVTLDGAPLVAPAAIRTDNDAYILVDEKEITVFWPDGFTTVSMTRVGTNTMSVYFTLATEFRDGVGGLMGNADTDRLNDPSFPDGTVSGNDFEAINRDLRDAWRVTGDESLFEGPTQFREDFPTEQIRLTGAEARLAREVCVGAGVVVDGLLEECTIDVALSGDPAAAEVQVEAQTERFRVRRATDGVSAVDPSLVGNNPGRAWQVAPVVIDGTRAWTFETDETDITGVRAVVPTSDGEALVVDVNNGLFLINTDGEILWNLEANLVAGVTPLVVGDTAYVATTTGVAAVGLDGRPRWELLLHGREEVVSLGYADGKIIATTTSSRVGLVLGIDPATGEVLWETASEVTIATVSLDTAVAIADGLIVVEGERGVVLALDPATGDTVWTYEPERTDTVSGISISDGVVYVAGRASGLTALDLATGELRWTVKSPAAGVTFRVAVGSGIAVMADTSNVWAVDVATGSLQWTVDKAEVDLGGQPIISGDLVYLNARPRQLVVLSVSDGSEVLRIDESLDSAAQDANRGFIGAPVQFGGLILVIDNAGDLVAYR